MGKAIVSFTTRPGQGSEGGVGWAFVSQGAQWALLNNQELHVVLDERDLLDVKNALAIMGNAGTRVHLVPVSVPAFLIRRFGDSRTRETYLGWSFRARAEVARLVAQNPIDTVHQVTFASTSMPHVLPTSAVGVKTVWGPVAIPSSTVHSRNKAPALREKLGVRILQRLGRHHARKVDLIIATNELTRISLGSHGTELEPNIIVKEDLPEPEFLDEYSLAMSGLLIDRKRPWLAILALQDDRLASYHLDVIGDGKLRLDMERLAKEIGVMARVRFWGRLDHDDALRVLGESRVLVHPASREGAAWVVGEAAALGVPAVVFQGAGAESTVMLSENGGGIVSTQKRDLVSALVEETLAVLARPKPLRSNRWSSARIQHLLDNWWAKP